jgi:SAM-dependent methyltransferase
MKIHTESLSDVEKYIERNPLIDIEYHKPRFENYLRHLRAFGRIESDAELLEIGIGTGWFPVLCALEGIHCKGLEVSPSLVEIARQYGMLNGVTPDVEVGNIEEYVLGCEKYDGVIASSVFEHVEYWQDGLANIFRALKPGGVMFFESTNRFSLTSGEYWMPLYGWLPDVLRYKLRVAVDGPDIMKLGIDFNQFTYGQLRGEFERIGFSRVLDRIDIADERFISSRLRRGMVSLGRHNSFARRVALTFADATRFVCIK